MKPKSVITKFQKELKTLVISAFGFVAALAWNDAITSLIQTYIPTQNAWPYMILKAVAVTLFAVLITVLLSRKSKES